MTMFTSKTNPILADARRARRRGYPYANVLFAFNECTEAAGHFMTTDWVRITDTGQIDHARRVLTRLASLEAS
jgi:hypothetical protein